MGTSSSKETACDATEGLDPSDQAILDEFISLLLYKSDRISSSDEHIHTSTKRGSSSSDLLDFDSFSNAYSKDEFAFDRMRLWECVIFLAQVTLDSDKIQTSSRSISSGMNGITRPIRTLRQKLASKLHHIKSDTDIPSTFDNTLKSSSKISLPSSFIKCLLACWFNSMDSSDSLQMKTLFFSAAIVKFAEESVKMAVSHWLDVYFKLYGPQYRSTADLNNCCIEFILHQSSLETFEALSGEKVQLKEIRDSFSDSTRCPLFSILNSSIFLLVINPFCHSLGSVPENHYLKDADYRMQHLYSAPNLLLSESLLKSTADLDELDVENHSGRNLVELPKAILSISDVVNKQAIWFAQFLIPIECRSLNWKLAFSTLENGHSWAQFFGVVQHSKSFILFVKDSFGHIFGSFVNEQLHPHPKFFGSDETLLFSVYPQMRIYRPTNYNSNFIYFNSNAASLPNGLGFGGQMDYFGFWISSDFKNGHSKAHPLCSTFNSPRLSARENFEIDLVVLISLEKSKSISALHSEPFSEERYMQNMNFLEMAGQRPSSKFESMIS